MVVYVLELKNSKFYIGSTSDLCKTIDEHVAKTFCEWTRINEYQDVFETFEGDRSDENKTVIRYMDKHGVDNVRGGMYKNTVLTFEEHLGIRKSIHYNYNCCLICGKKDHEQENCDSLICYRCGRLGHSHFLCDVKTHYYNGNLNGCRRCGRTDHWHYRCNRSKDVFGRPIKSACTIS
jgi:hypothetical protein